MRAEDKIFELIKTNETHFSALARVDGISRFEDGFDKSDAGTIVVQNIEFFIPMADLIDKEKEKQRLLKEVQRLEGLEKAVTGKLNNKNFVEKAPEKVVQAEKDKLRNIQENLIKVRGNYEKFN